MKKFKVLISEEIRVWQDVCVTINAESEEEISKSIEKGSFVFDYEFEDMETKDINFETEEHIQYDYYDVKIEEIEDGN